MTSADKMQSQLLAALAKLGAKHNIDAAPSATPRDAEAYVARQPRDRSAPSNTPSAPTRGRAAVSKDERKLEGMHADVTFAAGPVTVYIDSVEQRSSGVRAYVLRLDTRTREYVTLNRLDNVRESV